MLFESLYVRKTIISTTMWKKKHKINNIHTNMLMRLDTHTKEVYKHMGGVQSSATRVPLMITCLLANDAWDLKDHELNTMHASPCKI